MSGVCIGQKRELGSLRLELEAVCELPCGLAHISFQQAQGSQSFKVYGGQQLMLGCACQPSGNLLTQIQTRGRS